MSASERVTAILGTGDWVIVHEGHRLATAHELDALEGATAAPSEADQDALAAALYPHIWNGKACACGWNMWDHPSMWHNHAAEVVLAAGFSRTSQPVQVTRNELADAMIASDALSDDVRAEARVAGSSQREPFLMFADAVMPFVAQPVQVEVTDDMVIRLSSELNKHGENILGSTATETVCVCGQKFATTVAGWIDFNQHGKRAALSAALGGGK